MQTGSREGFRRLTFFTNASRGREALKCDLPLKTWRQDGRPRIRAWLRVTIPYILTLPLDTAYHMRGRSPFPTTPHTEQMCTRESVATFPIVATREGEGNVAPTTAVTTPYRSAVKSWMAVTERPRAARPVARVGPIGYTPPPPTIYTPQLKASCQGGGADSIRS